MVLKNLSTQQSIIEDEKISLSQGPILKKFENDIAKMFGAKYCVATSSATAALHITIKALNLKKNSLAYTSDMTFVATTNACLYNNLKINLVDINLDNFNLKIDDLEKKTFQER